MANMCECVGVFSLTCKSTLGVGVNGGGGRKGHKL